jgi:hypothetical protein
MPCRSHARHSFQLDSMRGPQVCLQEVPRSADHNAQRTFFLWHVDWSAVLK